MNKIFSIAIVANVGFAFTCLIGITFHIPWSWGHYVPFGVWVAIFMAGLLTAPKEAAAAGEPKEK